MQIFYGQIHRRAFIFSDSTRLAHGCAEGIFGAHRSCPRGKHLPGYLIEAGRVLGNEQAAMLEKLQSLTKNIDHIKNIVSTQQSYAGMSGVEQIVELGELLDDALNINVGSLDRDRIKVSKEYDIVPPFPYKAAASRFTRKSCASCL
jgi:hypothetical protein